MTDEEAHAAAQGPDYVRVHVRASDYGYDGWLVTSFWKKRGGILNSKLRCVVEDDNGRLFIHNPGQLERVK